MKNVVLTVLFLYTNLFCNLQTHAQPGWQWAASNSMITPGGGLEVFPKLVTDHSGNVFEIAQSFCDSITFGATTIYNLPHAAHAQLVMVKVDDHGNFLWVKATQNATVMFPISMATDANGYLYVLGSFSDSVLTIDTFNIRNDTFLGGGYYMTGVLLKLSPTGNVDWVKKIAHVDLAYNFGGCLGVDVENNVYVACAFNDTAVVIGSTTVRNKDTTIVTDTTSPGSDILMVKYDPSGNPLWAKSFGSYQYDYPDAMSVTPSGNIFLCGRYYDTMTVGSTVLIDTSTTGASRSFISKFNSSGLPVWAKNTDRHLFVSETITDPLENFYMIGSIDTNVVIGADSLPYLGGIRDLFFAKFDSSGNAHWARSVGSINGDAGFSIALDTCQDIWISGASFTADTIHFDGYTVIPPANQHEYVAKYNTLGDHERTMFLPVGSDDYNGIAIDNKNNFYVGGEAWGTPGAISYVFGPDTLTMIGMFIAKYDTACTVIGDTTTHLHLALHVVPQGLTLYPNPTTRELTISAKEKITNVTITNLLGQAVFAHEYNKELVRINVAHLPEGIYLVRVNGSEIRKFVKK